METLDAEVRVRCAKLFPHARFEVFGGIRITKDRLAFPRNQPTSINVPASADAPANGVRLAMMMSLFSIIATSFS